MLDYELQDTLFELLGDSSFEFIQCLLSKRLEILSSMSGAKPPSSKGSHKEPRGQNLVGQITIMTEEDKLLEKLKRKEKKKGKPAASVTSPDEWIPKALDVQYLREHREQQLSQPITIGNLAAAGTLEYRGGGQKVVLPEGTVRKETKAFDEYKIPPVKAPPLDPTEKMIPISELDDWAQVAFRGYKTLNRIQSRLFQAAYRSNENLLVCAPTGAGKTDVAMLTILHEIGQHYVGGRLQRDEFKIVYVAPMKALAAEVVEKFR